MPRKTSKKKLKMSSKNKKITDMSADEFLEHGLDDSDESFEDEEDEDTNIQGGIKNDEEMSKRESQKTDTNR